MSRTKLNSAKIGDASFAKAVFGCAAFVAAVVATSVTGYSQGQKIDGLNRLMHKAEYVPVFDPASPALRDGHMPPSVIRPASQDEPEADANTLEKDFPSRDDVVDLEPRVFLPQSLTRSMFEKNQKRANRGGEYLFDGNDRGKRIHVDSDWNVYGLESEDTIGHFDTLDGRRMVSPSNRVAIYAPRFSAVRKVTDLSRAVKTTRPRAFEEETPVQTARGKDFSTTTLQQMQAEGHSGNQRAGSFIDETRGVVSDTTTHLFGIRNTFEPFENLSLIRFGKFSSAELARLGLGLQSARVWEDETSLKVTTSNAQPIIANDVAKVQQIETIETDGDNAILRVLKIASKISARPGDEIQFTIRFDNISSRKIGNVTIIDDLTSRLEYVKGSVSSSMHATFKTTTNEAGSKTLRWEVRDPLEPGEGGVVRFTCLVR